jgi:ribonuclease E
MDTLPVEQSDGPPAELEEAYVPAPAPLETPAFFGAGSEEVSSEPLAEVAAPEPEAAFVAGPVDFSEPEPEPEREAVLVAPAANDAEPVVRPAPREPDPAEITAPPAQPRRGWWRGRG